MATDSSCTPEKVMIQVNGLMLTLLLLFSQLVPAEQDRFSYAFTLMGAIGIFFLISLIIGVSVLFYDQSKIQIEMLRQAEMIFFLVGSFLLTLLIIYGYQLSGQDPMQVLYLVLLFSILSAMPYIGSGIKKLIRSIKKKLG